MVSFGSGGKSKSKSKQESKTVFPRGFFDEAVPYFGGDPGYDPEYVGFNDFDRVEDNLYGTQRSKLDEGFRNALNIQNEELSNSGLLNSPSKYIEGGARDTLNKGYISSLQQAARDAALGRLGMQQQEATRRTSFNQENALAILNAWLQRMGLAATAGRESSGTSSGSAGGGFSFGISNPFKLGGE